MKIRLAAAALFAGAVTAAGVTGAPEAVRSALLGDAAMAPAAPETVEAAMPEAVVRQLAREGYYGFRRIARRHDRYVVHAYSRGRLMRVVADARSGRILAARVLVPAGAEPAP